MSMIATQYPVHLEIKKLCVELLGLPKLTMIKYLQKTHCRGTVVFSSISSYIFTHLKFSYKFANTKYLAILNGYLYSMRHTSK